MDAHIDAVLADIESAPIASPEDAEAFRVRFLGRKSGAVTALFGQMGAAPPEARRALGQRLNELKHAAEARLEQATVTAGPAAERTSLDLTLPGRVPGPVARGTLHPLTQALADIEAAFRRLGFAVARGPEIEDDWHNFTALNFPPEHPARDMQDTFFLEPPPPDGRGVLLRTHTSPVQVRVLEAAVAARTGAPGTLDAPVRVIAPGRVFRNEAISYKSFCLFHQVEGLVVDETATFAGLKSLLTAFAADFFGHGGAGGGPRMQFRPSFFPFTEPSAEVDVWWEGTGEGRWMEILGCGMVDPAVLESVGIDPERYTGYAFGMGAERLAMLRHGIDDIRLLYENDVRFLSQF
jgi:phenylalanyl-tRNA synthetase alpha chain